MPKTQNLGIQAGPLLSPQQDLEPLLPLEYVKVHFLRYSGAEVSLNTADQLQGHRLGSVV